MIDLLANLLRTGWIDRRGVFERSRSSPAIAINGKRASYVIVAANESATGEPLMISEAEIAMLLGAFIFGHHARHRGTPDQSDGDDDRPWATGTVFLQPRFGCCHQAGVTHLPLVHA